MKFSRLTAMFALPVLVLALGAFTTAVADTQNPPKPLTTHVANFKPKAKAIKDELKKGINNGGDLDTLLDKFNTKMDKLQEDFVNLRAAEYAATREVQQKPSFQAEKNSVNPGSARRSQSNSAVYDAPPGMRVDNININPKTEIGDTNKSSGESENGTKAHVSINARSRGRPDGKSHIIVEPIITWRFADPEKEAEEDWVVLKDLIK